MSTLTKIKSILAENSKLNEARSTFNASRIQQTVQNAAEKFRNLPNISKPNLPKPQVSQQQTQTSGFSARPPSSNYTKTSSGSGNEVTVRGSRDTVPYRVPNERIEKDITPKPKGLPSPANKPSSNISALRTFSPIAAAIQGYQSGKSDAKTNPNKSTGGFSKSILTGAGLGSVAGVISGAKSDSGARGISGAIADARSGSIPGGFAGGLGYLAGKAFNRSPNSDPRIGRWDNRSSATTPSASPVKVVQTPKPASAPSSPAAAPSSDMARKNPPPNAATPAVKVDRPAPSSDMARKNPPPNAATPAVKVNKPTPTIAAPSKPANAPVVRKSVPTPDTLKQQVGVTARASQSPLTGKMNYSNAPRGSSFSAPNVTKGSTLRQDIAKVAASEPTMGASKFPAGAKFPNTSAFNKVAAAEPKVSNMGSTGTSSALSGAAQKATSATSNLNKATSTFGDISAKLSKMGY